MGSAPSMPGGRRVATKAQTIAGRLTTAIAVRAFSPVTGSPERTLAEMLGVSRVTVREAIRIVTELGLLTSIRGRDGGTFVTEADWTRTARSVARQTLELELPALREFCDYRCLVEATIARTAAERCTEVDATRLLARLAEFEVATDLTVARDVDRRLHSEIAMIARNERLAVLSVELSAEATLGFGSEPYPAEFLDRARREHHDLVHAVVEGDEQGAYDLARSHYALTLENFELGLARAAGEDP